MGKYFGTDGFRGEANKNLIAIHAYKIGAFLAYYYITKESKRDFVIGMDTRLSNTMFLNAISAGLNSFGGNAYILGVTTTPSVAYLAKEKNFACGIMISASHNPYYDNGIKLINSLGEKMSEDVILQIEDYIDDKITIPLALRNEIGKTIPYSEGIELYKKHLIANGLNLKGLRIGLDLANGSATSVAKEIFTSLGADIKVINDKPDGININTNCGSTHIEGLQKLVKENKLDCGFAFDGDSDRCLGVKGDGTLLDGDAIMYLYASYLKDNNKLLGNTVTTTIMSNFGLYKALDKKNISYVKTKVGDKYVYEYMKQNPSSIGGEQSGHIIFIDIASTGDGILTALKVLEVMINTNKTLVDLTKDLIIYPQVLKNIKVSDKKLAQEDIDVKNAIRSVEEKLNGEGRILVRESGTEPLIRVMVESKTIEDCNKYIDLVINQIKNKGYEIK